MSETIIRTGVFDLGCIHLWFRREEVGRAFAPLLIIVSTGPGVDGLQGGRIYLAENHTESVVAHRSSDDVITVSVSTRIRDAHVLL